MRKARESEDSIARWRWLLELSPTVLSEEEEVACGFNLKLTRLSAALETNRQYRWKT